MGHDKIFREGPQPLRDAAESKRQRTRRPSRGGCTLPLQEWLDPVKSSLLPGEAAHCFDRSGWILWRRTCAESCQRLLDGAFGSTAWLLDAVTLVRLHTAREREWP
jgi:hypothetical protein